MTLPRFDHETLARYARQLADRAQGEEPRRIYRALADLWTAVADGQPLPRPMRAKRHEIRAQLRSDIARAQGVQREGLEALLFYHSPSGMFDHDAPMIVMVHEINQSRGADRAAQPQNPGGQAVERSAERAPLQQRAAAPVARAAVHQPGLL